MSGRELLLLEGITLQGLGNWQAISEHVGTRTKEEVEKHYNAVYIDSPNWPLPVRLFPLFHSHLPMRLCLIFVFVFREWTSTSTLILQSSRNANGDEYPR